MARARPRSDTAGRLVVWVVLLGILAFVTAPVVLIAAQIAGLAR